MASLYRTESTAGGQPANNAVARERLQRVSDKTLVAAAKGGQTAAFEILCERCTPRIHRTAYRITRNREDAEDAIQDCLLSAFVHLKDFDGRSSFSTWVTRIAVNSSLRILRKKRPSLELPIDDGANAAANGRNWRLVDHAPDPETHYARYERTQVLKNAIRALRPSLRQAIEIQQTREPSMKEAAELLGISEGATRSRLFQARAALRHKLRSQAPPRAVRAGLNTARLSPEMLASQ